MSTAVLKLQTSGSALILMQLIGNEKCIPARVVRSSEYISQIVNNVHCFTLYLPFVFFISLIVRMTVWLIYSDDLAKLMPARPSMFYSSGLQECLRRVVQPIKKFRHISYEIKL